MSSKIIRAIILIAALASFVLLAVLGFLWGYSYVRKQDQRMTALSDLAQQRGGNLVAEDSPGAIAVYVPRSASMAEISALLQEKGLIGSQTIFKLVSKFNGFDGNYQAGTHYLFPNMSYDEIMFILTRQPKPLQITFPEGMSYRQMKQSMKAAGLNLDESRMDELVRHPNSFLDYAFVRQLKVNEQREWLLQGYLWPDTYRFDPNMDEESILRMFLDNTAAKLADSEYASRAARLGLSLDEALTLASVTQKEGNIAEMSKIGRVFLNRIKQNMPLESCASINYLRSEEDLEPEFWASAADLQKYRNNAYNTYAFAGLPPGPINNPGTVAIEGILWPANEDTWAGATSFLYFCATGDGGNDFSASLAEHEQKVEHYRSIWEEASGEN